LLTRNVKIFAKFMMRSTLSGIVRVLLVDKDNDSYKKYTAPMIDAEIRCCIYYLFDAPSRTITFRSRTPLPIFKALYRVRENITLSKNDTVAHAMAVAVFPSYYR